ncbi:heavy-metal-associated domain-containing protein [Sulfurospirillum arcachonense]|uniref:heavy-metal-associated domain-containing protein n=1 Tax=Sulfurospirillum arcachonense TaxID=57666 RepID=UPI0004696A79|nr:heavy metal-associated domain-containing protein [Sulfurospirillum arcachonense]
MKKVVLFLVLSVFVFAKEHVAVISVEGMTCPLCTTAVKKSLKSIDGVVSAKVKLNTKKAIVHFDEKVRKKQLLEAIKKVGYKGIIDSVTKE